MTKQILRRKAISLAVAAALPVLTVSGNVYAACSGSVASPSTANSVDVLCNGADPTPGAGVGSLTNASATDYVDTTTQTANGSTTVIQFDGEGRTLTNSGIISNNRTVNFATGTGRNRTAVLMGAATLNASANTVFGSAPAAGVTTVTLNAAPTAAYVGQTMVFGRYNAAEGDFVTGVTRIITAVDTGAKTVTFADALPVDYAGDGTDPVGYKVVSNFGGGNNVVNNSGTISAQILATEINANRNSATVTATSIANGVANIVSSTDDKAAAYTSSAKAVTMSVEGIYEVNNAAGGTISVRNEGIGQAYAVEQGGAATSLTLVNDGTISAERTAHVTLVDNLAVNSAVVAAPNATATSFSATTATSSDFSWATKQNLASVNAINTQEEGELLDVTNTETGIIRATGDYAGAIYMRNIEQKIVNQGLIEWVAATGHTGARGYAIGSVSDSGEIRTLNLENSGTINGDILGVNGMAERWHNLSVEGTLDNRLTINSQFGQLDSTITNSGTVAGDIYLSNGTHVLTNQEGATLTGSIDLDQRDTTCGQASTYQAGCGTSAIGENARQTGIVEVQTTSGSKSQTINVYSVSPAAGTVTTDITGLSIASTATNPTASASNASATASTFTGIFTTVGTKSFTFENAGTFNGNLTIRTASSSVLGGVDPVVSQISLIPTIVGSGSGSTLASPSTNIAGLGNTLNVITTAGGDESDVTIAPKIATGVVVKNGEYFRVASTYQIDGVTVGAGVTSVPTVENTNSLLTWSAEVNASGNLVLTSAVDTSAVSGVSSGASKALDALFGFDSELGNAVQNLASDDDIRKAAEQLRPEVNNASVSAALGITTQVQNVVDNHIADVHLAKAGMSGIATGEGALENGFWIQGFGFRGDQDRRKGVDGYDADAGGLAFGADTLINPDLRVGAAFSYGNTSVDAKGVNQGNSTDLDSYQGLVYASLLGNGWYLNGSLGLGKHDYDSRRLVTVPTTQTLKGSHDAWQYSARVEAGYPFKLGESVTLIPSISLAYSYLDEDSYTEHGGSAALRVKSNNTDSIRSGLGAKALVKILDGQDMTATLEGRANWLHEFGDATQDTTASFAAGGGTFTTKGVDIDEDAFNVGASLLIAGKNSHQSLTLSYDAEIKDEYLGQTAKLQARFDF